MGIEVHMQCTRQVCVPNEPMSLGKQLLKVITSSSGKYQVHCTRSGHTNFKFEDHNLVNFAAQQHKLNPFLNLQRKTGLVQRFSFIF